MAKSAHTLYGTLNLLILQTLRKERRHGLGILRAIGSASHDALQIEEGALYPALHRLERDGLLVSEWGLSENRRRAKYYRLSDRGRARLERETNGWRRHVSAVARVLEIDKPGVGG